MMPRIPESAGSALFFDIPDDGDTETELGIVSRIAERHGSSAADSWCGSDEADKRRMKEFRHAVPKTIFEYVASLKGTMPGIHKLGSDMSVPDDRSEEMMAFYRSELDAAGLEYCMFGHIGNNHPHVEIILKSEEEFETARKIYERFAAKAVDLGGSASAEHGIGKLKIRYMNMMYGDEGVEALRRVKSILDPNWILSPGNMIGDRK